MFPTFPPPPRDVIGRRDGFIAAIGVTIAVLACIATGFLIGWLA